MENIDKILEKESIEIVEGKIEKDIEEMENDGEVEVIERMKNGVS